MHLYQQFFLFSLIFSFLHSESTPRLNLLAPHSIGCLAWSSTGIETISSPSYPIQDLLTGSCLEDSTCPLFKQEGRLSGCLSSNKGQGFLLQASGFEGPGVQSSNVHLPRKSDSELQGFTLSISGP